MAGRGICNNYARNGSCRFGNSCKFLHDVTGNATSRSTHPARRGTPAPPSSPGGSRPRNSPSASLHGGPATNVPRDVCRIFWGTGTCDRLFDCSFKHVRGSPAAASNSSVPDTSTEEPPEFFSAEGIAVNGGAKRLALDPTSAHNNIQPFLRDNYRFNGASQMQGFVNVIASVNDRNKAWVSCCGLLYSKSCLTPTLSHRTQILLKCVTRMSR